MRILILSFAAFATLGMASCKKDLLDINTDPNRATFSTAQLTMPVALEGAARVANTSYISLAFWVGYWATSSGFAKPAETYTYNITSTYLSGVWDNLYNNITDLDYVEKKAMEQNLPVYEAIGKVMKAYDYHQLVDLWGNVPYTEALQGATNFSPKYDDGQAIYEDLIKKIDSAVLIFKKPSTAASVIVNTDKARILIFGPSIFTTADIPAFITKWIRLSNTLKLKLLVQQSQIPGRDAYIKQNLQGLTSADFLGLGEDALLNPGYTIATAKLNPYYAAFYKANLSAGDGYNSTRASDYAATRYKATNDPRISYFYTRVGTDYVGSVFGDPSGNGNAATVGAPSLNATGNSIIMTAAESLFLQAEAVQRGYITGNAKQLFQDGVLSSFQFTAVPNAATAATTYTAQADPDVNWDLATDKIKVIISQKWFALNGIDILAVYNDYRRTGFPAVPLSTDPNSKGRVPLRLLYPQRENQLNTASVLAQGNVDVFTTTVFWDK